MATASVQNVQVGGVDALYAPAAAANGHTLLFVHGVWVGGWIWDGYLDYFSRRGYECYSLTLRGHTRPTPGIGKVSIYEYVADVCAAARAIGNPVLVGHSLGGLLVQKAAETLQPPALVLLAPGAPRGIFAIASPLLLKLAARHVHEMLFSLPILASKAELAEVDMNRMPPDQQDQLYAKLIPDSGHHFLEMAVLGVPVDASRITCPVLSEVGSDDRFVPPRVVRAVAHKYEGTVHEHPDHAHMLNVEPGWQNVAEDVAHWLEQVLPARTALGNQP